MMRIVALLRKELIQMRRDPMTIGVTFLLPLVYLIVFGMAISTDVKHQSTVVFDQSRSEESRSFLAAMTASGYFDLRYIAYSYEELDERIQNGDARIGIVFPPDLTAEANRGRTVPIQAIVDASDSIGSTSAIAALTGLGIHVRPIAARGTPAITPAYDVRIRAWYNPDAVTAYYMLPALMGIILSLTMVLMTSMAIVRERETGTLEQLLVTPLHVWELLVGKILPYIALGYIQATVSIIVALAVFGVPLRGSIPLLYALTTLFLLASLTMGLMISSLARSQLQAGLLSLATLLPAVLLSGFMFPRDAMPAIFQYISLAIPMTHYIEIQRMIFLKGGGIAALWHQTLFLAGFTLLFFGVAVRKFKRSVG
jgi:multidrug ABC superfamily ATP binding cassette transporter permease protein